MKEYLEEMDPLSSRHRELGQSAAKTQRSCKTSRTAKRDTSQKPNETAALKHSKSIISDEKNTKQMSMTKKGKNASQAAISGPKKVKKALQQSIISIGQRKRKSPAHQKKDLAPKPADKGTKTRSTTAKKD